VNDLKEATIDWNWEGRRLFVVDANQFFLVLDGMLRRIPDEGTFLRLFRAITNRTDIVPAVLPVGPELDRDAELLQASDGRVYLVSGNERRHIRDQAAMCMYGFEESAVIGVPDEIILAIPSGLPIPSEQRSAEPRRQL
jgi:hypothetical protein